MARLSLSRQQQQQQKHNNGHQRRALTGKNGAHTSDIRFIGTRVDSHGDAHHFH